jgi:hypothetical protein
MIFNLLNLFFTYFSYSIENKNINAPFLIIYFQDALVFEILIYAYLKIFFERGLIL